MREDPPWLGSPVRVSRWQPIDLEPVLRGETVTPAPSILERRDGVFFFYAGRISALIGETESGKTWVAMAAIAQELAAGRHVIYADYEDGPESAVERLRALGVSAEDVAGHLTYLNPGGRFDELAEAVVAEAIEKRGPVSLAVIDGVTEAMADIGLDPEKGTDVAAYYAGSPRWLARTGAAVVLVDHVTKSREGRGRWAIGSERKLSGLDGAAYGLESLRPFGRGKTGLVKMTVAKDRCGHVRQHAGAAGVIAMIELKSWPDDGVTVSFDVPEVTSDETFRPTHLMARLSEYIAEHPGMTTRALHGAVTGKGETKTLALELLVSDGYAEARPGARGARLYYSLRPFGTGPEPEEREDDDEPF
jgi:AAA domain-containing protein